jgi:hypothetical protein
MEMDYCVHSKGKMEYYVKRARKKVSSLTDLCRQKLHSISILRARSCSKDGGSVNSTQHLKVHISAYSSSTSYLSWKGSARYR